MCSVNVGSREPNPWKRAGWTGIGKEPVDGPVRVGVPRAGDSGLDGDFIGDRRHHGGPDQAVYAFAAEDLGHWERTLGALLPDGSFGENLTTSGIDVNASPLGERWRVGRTVELVVTVPRIPCGTFAGVMGTKGWLKQFTAEARPGAYLSVAVPGLVQQDDPIEVLHRPDHGVTISQCFRALTTQPELLPGLASAGSDLTPELAARVRGR
ncbi:MOSC domain-containing protein [Nocardioides mangrovicus]|uniref:MOSC domain-containing protein n=1 Tax=Nocardioides mangrovicus TaxID=2478913 RepID=A0A3L8P6M4_9ACTN|nr:MOSC domain-containing protein [Nocardioides mangrovicus]